MIPPRRTCGNCARLGNVPERWLLLTYIRLCPRLGEEVIETRPACDHWSRAVLVAVVQVPHRILEAF